MGEAEYCRMQWEKSEPCAKCAVLKADVERLTKLLPQAQLLGAIKNQGEMSEHYGEKVRVLELQLRETQEVLSSLAFAVYEDIRSTGPFKIQPSRALKQAMEAAVKLKAVTPKGVQ